METPFERVLVPAVIVSRLQSRMLLSRFRFTTKNGAMKESRRSSPSVKQKASFISREGIFVVRFREKEHIVIEVRMDENDLTST